MNAVKIRLKAGALPKMLADLSHSNQFLKMFAAGSLTLSLMLVTLVYIALARKPIVITLSDKADVLKPIALPNPEAEVRQAILAYVERRYNWTSATIDHQLDSAKAFVASQSSDKFSQGLESVRKFSKDKNVTQRAYPAELSVDLKRGTVLVEGDRITEIQGMRAAGSLNLELSYQSGPRSFQNPWGVYVTKETEK